MFLLNGYADYLFPISWIHFMPKSMDAAKLKPEPWVLRRHHSLPCVIIVDTLIEHILRNSELSLGR